MCHRQRQRQQGNGTCVGGGWRNGVSFGQIELKYSYTAIWMWRKSGAIQDDAENKLAVVTAGFSLYWWSLKGVAPHTFMQMCVSVCGWVWVAPCIVSALTECEHDSSLTFTGVFVAAARTRWWDTFRSFATQNENPFDILFTKRICRQRKLAPNTIIKPHRRQQRQRQRQRQTPAPTSAKR